MGLLDTFKIDFKCQECGREFQKTHYWVKNNGVPACPRGHNLDITEEDMQGIIAAAERGIDEL